MNSLLQELQETFFHEIPLTQHIELRVISYQDGTLILKAPLALNVNHQQTAFAGSLNAALTLAGWGQIWLILKELNIPGNIVIQDSSSNYLLPVEQDFSALCCRPSAGEIARLAATLTKKGKARLELAAEIHSAGTIAATFRGRYVIFHARPENVSEA